jgi:hypothetical protein
MSKAPLVSDSVKSPLSILNRLAIEPPFRLFVKHALALLPCSVDIRAKWDLSARPPYLMGVLFAAREARAQKIHEISVIEFGVASGNGLVALQNEAEAVEQATGVSIRVYGFDAGPGGLPSFCGDYRDHPDVWKPGDYAMDLAALQPKLAARTTLILGDVRETAEKFREDYDPSPIGFMSIDLDLYSSTVAALKVLDLCPILRHLAIYCDDIDVKLCHRWAGERLALAEFNEAHDNLKIDQWHGLRDRRPFPELPWINRMFLCHDLESISKCAPERAELHL